MKSLLSFCLLSLHLLLPALAQGLPAKILLAANQEVIDVVLFPRRAGTTEVRLEQKGQEGIRTLGLEEIQGIRFDLSALKPGTLTQLYMIGNYDTVIQALAGRIIPYFSFVDQNANSNEVIQTFIKSLYRAGNTNSVLAAVQEIEKYSANGEMKRFADVYRTLTYLKEEDMEALDPYRSLFQRVSYQDPYAPELWYANARLALREDDWKTANRFLAQIITEKPMQTDWSGEALFLSATYHHSRTNLVVANQICQEIQIVAPLTEWPEKAAELETRIQQQAADLGIELVLAGGIREGEKEAGDSKIDYKERQRRLKEEEAERLRKELEQAEAETP